MLSYGEFRCVGVRPRRLGRVRLVSVGCGVFPQAWHGLVMLCDVCCGTSTQAWRGTVRHGELWWVLVRPRRLGLVGSGVLR